MEIQELKRYITILDVADRLGIKVDKHHKAHCPFHDDKTPSLQFSKEKDIATCFSSQCNAGTMDIIGLTEKYQKVSTHEAILQLKTWAGLSADKAGHPPANGKPKPDEPKDLERIALLTKAFQYYENGLKTSSKAKNYLESRGLTQATPNQQGITVGFNSGKFHNRINKNLHATALKYGLLYESHNNNGGYSPFAKDSLVFPLKSKDNKTVSLYFRSITDNNQSNHLYLKDRQGLYPNYPSREARHLIITESIIDAATLIQCLRDTEYCPLKGTTGVLACYGTNGLTDEHIEAMSQLAHLEEITIFFDGDAAGSAGVEKQSKKLKDHLPNIKIYQVNAPEKEDINSLYIGHQDQAEELFKHLISERKLLTSIESRAETPANPKSKTTTKRKAVSDQRTASIDTSNPNNITYLTDTAHYYIKGGLRPELDRLQVSIMIETNTNTTYGRYRNRLDLYENKQVERIAREAAEKHHLRADLVELDLHRLTDQLEDYRDNQMPNGQTSKPTPILDNTTTSQCKTFLEKPNLIPRFNQLIGKAGVIGEDNNRIFLFCIAASYKMSDTLHALIQGSSGSGKTHLLVKISSLIPDEETKRFTRVTESSFYNYDQYELQHKLICLEDLDGMKEEAQLAFRELQSREMLSSSTSGQDEKGKIRSFEKVVYGPIASMSCTTKGEIYEDNMNRCFLIAVDETQAQTQQIIQYQNNLAAGTINKAEQKKVTTFIQNCIRMLKPCEVINPYANKVQLPEEAHKIRRLNDLYQSFVKQITLMNQYRRKQDQQGRLITEKEDLQTAAEIMFDSIVLKIDELDGSLRLFYENLKTYVKSKGASYESYSFGQREIRQALHISKSQLQRYIYDLLSLEYIHNAGGHINKGYRYKIAYWDNVAQLRSKVKRHLQGQLDQLEMYQEEK